MLTRKQHSLLAFMKAYTEAHGYAPSFDEMTEAMDLRSKSGVHRLILGLEERGFIKRLPHRSRAIMIVPQGEPTPEMIRAGGEALFDGPPEDWVENPGAIAARVFKAMIEARI